MAEVKEPHQQLALQAKEAEADQKTALANLKEKYIYELNQLRQEIKKLTEENFRIKVMKKSK